MAENQVVNPGEPYVTGILTQLEKRKSIAQITAELPYDEHRVYFLQAISWIVANDKLSSFIHAVEPDPLTPEP